MILTYLVRQDVKWDNQFMRVLCAGLMLTVFTGIKQDARRSSRVRASRRSKTENAWEPELTPGEEIQEFRRRLDSLHNDSEWKAERKRRFDDQIERLRIAKQIALESH